MAEIENVSSYVDRFNDEAMGYKFFLSELDTIRNARNTPNDLKSDKPSASKLKLAGLALSGGGIRSATFNLGLLQALCRQGHLKNIDYLSTVSGGGYIGSSLTTLLNSFKDTDVPIDLLDCKNFPFSIQCKKAADCGSHVKNCSKPGKDAEKPDFFDKELQKTDPDKFEQMLSSVIIEIRSLKFWKDELEK